MASVCKDVLCRSAVPEDVEPLYQMISGYAERGIMLPRSREVLTRQLELFIVAEVDGEVVGCGSLCKLGADLVEIRSLASLRDTKVWVLAPNSWRALL